MSDIFRAELDTQHFSFEAYGETEAQAREAIEVTLARHAVQTEISAADLLEAMRESINIYPVAVGHGYRDHTRITANPVPLAHKRTTIHFAHDAERDRVIECCEAAGFRIHHTGGRCLAWRRGVRDGHYVMISDESGTGLGETLGEKFTVEFYDASDAVVGSFVEDGLDAAIACSKKIIDPRQGRMQFE